MLRPAHYKSDAVELPSIPGKSPSRRPGGFLDLALTAADKYALSLLPNALKGTGLAVGPPDASQHHHEPQPRGPQPHGMIHGRQQQHHHHHHSPQSMNGVGQQSPMLDSKVVSSWDSSLREILAALEPDSRATKPAKLRDHRYPINSYGHVVAPNSSSPPGRRDLDDALLATVPGTRRGRGSGHWVTSRGASKAARRLDMQGLDIQYDFVPGVKLAWAGGQAAYTAGFGSSPRKYTSQLVGGKASAETVHLPEITAPGSAGSGGGGGLGSHYHHQNHQHYTPQPAAASKAGGVSPGQHAWAQSPTAASSTSARKALPYVSLTMPSLAKPITVQYHPVLKSPSLGQHGVSTLHAPQPGGLLRASPSRSQTDYEGGLAVQRMTLGRGPQTPPDVAAELARLRHTAELDDVISGIRSDMQAVPRSEQPSVKSKFLQMYEDPNRPLANLNPKELLADVTVATQQQVTSKNKQASLSSSNGVRSPMYDRRLKPLRSTASAAAASPGAGSLVQRQPERGELAEEDRGMDRIYSQAPSRPGSRLGDTEGTSQLVDQATGQTRPRSARSSARSSAKSTPQTTVAGDDKVEEAASYATLALEGQAYEDAVEQTAEDDRQFDGSAGAQEAAEAAAGLDAAESATELAPAEGGDAPSQTDETYTNAVAAVEHATLEEALVPQSEVPPPPDVLPVPAADESGFQAALSADGSQPSVLQDLSELQPSPAASPPSTEPNLASEHATGISNSEERQEAVSVQSKEASGLEGSADLPAADTGTFPSATEEQPALGGTSSDGKQNPEQQPAAAASISEEVEPSIGVEQSLDAEAEGLSVSGSREVDGTAAATLQPIVGPEEFGTAADCLIETSPEVVGQVDMAASCAPAGDEHAQKAADAEPTQELGHSGSATSPEVQIADTRTAVPRSSSQISEMPETELSVSIPEPDAAASAMSHSSADAVGLAMDHSVSFSLPPGVTPEIANRAALRIQSHARGHLARKQVAALRATKDAGQSALKAAVSAVETAKQQLLSYELPAGVTPEEADAAAVKVQAHMRGHLARRRVQRMRAGRVAHAAPTPTAAMSEAEAGLPADGSAAAQVQPLEEEPLHELTIDALQDVLMADDGDDIAASTQTGVDDDGDIDALGCLADPKASGRLVSGDGPETVTDTVAPTDQTGADGGSAIDGDTEGSMERMVTASARMSAMFEGAGAEMRYSDDEASALELIENLDGLLQGDDEAAAAAAAVAAAAAPGDGELVSISPDGVGEPQALHAASLGSAGAAGSRSGASRGGSRPANPLDAIEPGGVRVLGRKYEVAHVVGEGAYGMVMKCKVRGSDPLQWVAIKEFKIEDSDPDAEDVKRTSLREVAVLEALKHPHVVRFVDKFMVGDRLFIVMEFLPCNLLELLEAQPGGMDRDAVRLIMFQMCSAITFIHSKGMVYRDIKPENLLVDEHGTVKLCDFGFARYIPSSPSSHLTDYVATRWYRAPELLLGPPFRDAQNKQQQYMYGPPVDMWAVGCLMGELLDGEPLFAGDSDLDQLYRVQQILGPMAPRHEYMFYANPHNAGIVFNIKQPLTLAARYVGKVSSAELDFMSGLLAMDPDKRLTGEQCLMHPYLADLTAAAQGLPGMPVSPSPQPAASASDQEDDADQVGPLGSVDGEGLKEARRTSTSMGSVAGIHTPKASDSGIAGAESMTRGSGSLSRGVGSLTRTPPGSLPRTPGSLTRGIGSLTRGVGSLTGGVPSSPSPAAGSLDGSGIAGVGAAPLRVSSLVRAGVNGEVVVVTGVEPDSGGWDGSDSDEVRGVAAVKSMSALAEIEAAVEEDQRETLGQASDDDEV